MMSLEMAAKRKTSVSFPFQQTQLSHFHDHLDIVQPSCGNKSRNIFNETLQCFAALCAAAKPHDCQARNHRLTPPFSLKFNQQSGVIFLTSGSFSSHLVETKLQMFNEVLKHFPVLFVSTQPHSCQVRDVGPEFKSNTSFPFQPIKPGRPPSVRFLTWNQPQATKNLWFLNTADRKLSAPLHSYRPMCTIILKAGILGSRWWSGELRPECRLIIAFSVTT